ncbi:MAG: ACT domain-containing protein [Eubacterium sp.]|nr:ACT domain-containing protein [Eubacterium sp.]
MTQEKKTEKDAYYLVRGKAVPDVLLKVLEARKLMKSGKLTVQQAADAVGISRSSFYKYQDDIFPFHESAGGTNINFMLQINDVPGILSGILETVARFSGNILTIHQSIPINGLATLSISVELPVGCDVDGMVHCIEGMNGVQKLQILGRD